MENKENKQITRKDFLKGVGVSVAGVAMVGGVGGLLTACTGDSASVDTDGKIESPQWPYEYKKLDPDKVAERAYNAYKTQGG